MTEAIFGQAFSEYLRARRSIPWIVMGVLCLLLAIAWQRLSPEATPADRYSAVSSILVYRILALVSAIFTTAIVTQEVEQRTIVYLLTRPVPRWKLLLVRYAASVTAVILLAWIAAVLTSFGAFGGSGFGNGDLAKDLLGLAVGAAAYGALFLLVSLAFNRALIMCVLFAFGWEASIPNLPGDLYKLSIYSYLQAIAPRGVKAEGLLAVLGGTAGNNRIPTGEAWLVLGGMVVGLLAISAWWFTHFEFTPREDAE